MSAERWEPIPGSPGYEASTWGRIKGPRGLLRDFRLGKSYRGVGIPGRPQKHSYVHLLVCEAHIGPRPPGLEVCHYDNNPSNNRLSNLRYDTPVGNAADRKRHAAERRAAEQRA